ncbi:MAG: tyrosine-type recombinase/integrase [Candidatus Latescibacteria bacterium]|nr:tyrosine-type recombinase/integrase [Candidatus Latescibacterota bacterium]
MAKEAKGKKGQRKKEEKEKKSALEAGHEGVYLMARKYPSGNIGWRAKWKDPDTGRTEWVTLTEKDYPTERSRLRWVKIKSAEINTRKGAISAGAPRRKDVALDKAVEDYYRRKKPELREKTITTYQYATSIFKQWAAERNLGSSLDLRPADLADLRTYVLSYTRRKPVTGGQRGQRRPTGRKRAAYTTNRDLRTLRQVLNDWRRLGWLLPVIDSDMIGDQLKSIRNPRPVPTFLRTRELKRIIDAAMRHDRDTFAMTRKEKAGIGKPGTTLRYIPVSPFLLTILLTGLRLGEAEGLAWREVDLKHKEIVLQPDRVKTHHGRRIDLSVCPALLRILGALKLRAGEDEYVFDGTVPLSNNLVKAAHRRLLSKFDSPKFTWQELRRTCGTYLTCAPGIYGASSVFLSAKRLGHSVSVAEKHYLGAVTDIDPEARTIEAAMGIEDLLKKVAPVRGRARKGASSG